MNETGAGHNLSCTRGMFLPVWQPQEDVTTGQVVGRGITYVLSMYFLFIGLAYLADIFMSAIEMITSTKKEVRVTNDKGEEEVVVVRIWNQTVANLSLIALGGAAAEVFLSNLELIKHGFLYEELGPSQMVASASFNVMVIISVCVFVIPKGESRQIMNFEVFLVVAGWSLFAYLWLILATSVISPGVIQVWEGVLTLIFFPTSLSCAYFADRYWSKDRRDGRTTTKTYQLGFRNKLLVETTVNDEEDEDGNGNGENPPVDHHLKRFSVEERDEKLRQFENHRREFITSLKKLRQEHPLVDTKQLELMATKELLDRGSKSKAFSRMKASKKLTGLSSWRIRKETDLEFPLGSPARPSTATQAEDLRVTSVFFCPGHYTVEENVGIFTATVCRQRGDLTRQVLVDYETEDADATAGRKYNPVRGTLCFQPGQTKKFIEISIIDDAVYEGDQHFYIRLFNPRFGRSKVGKPGEKGLVNPDAYAIPERSRAFSFMSPVSEPLVKPNGLLQVSHKRPRLHASHSESEAEDSTGPIPPLKSALKSSRYSVSYGEILLDVKKAAQEVNKSKSKSIESLAGGNPLLRLACPSLATVLILDDDHSGVFTLAKSGINIKSSSVGVCSMQILRCGGTRGRVALPYRTEEGTARPDKDYRHCEGELVFEDGEIEKVVTVGIHPVSFYAEDLLFFFTLGEPKLLHGDEGVDAKQRDLPAIVVNPPIEEEDEAEEREASSSNPLGWPQLGEISKSVIRLNESTNFKNSLHKIMKRSQIHFVGATEPWKQQFVDAVHWERDDYGEESSSDPKPHHSWVDYVKYGLTIFWRLLFACIPPPELFSGFATFFTCILSIAVLVVFLGDMAYALGCTVGLELKVTSLVFVSIGTSVPDLFASRVFAKRSPTADACITNVFGSNIIQIYLGMGLCWTMGSIYHHSRGGSFEVDPGSLSFMASYFLLNAAVVVITLILRRKYAGGELGGASRIKIPTSIFFIGMWLTFVVINSLEAYGLVTI